MAARPTLVLATANAHKVEELRTMLHDAPVRVLSLRDAGVTAAVEETGATLEENALFKARAAFTATGHATIADDTGLEVEALDGAPGVHSARYAGPDCAPADNRRLLLERLRAVVPAARRARFRCVIALVTAREELLFEGIVNGAITLAERGTAGFGYDAVFVPEGSDRTFAEMDAGEKNARSHRGRALEAVVTYLRTTGIAAR